jgi:hypothetical protein
VSTRDHQQVSLLQYPRKNGDHQDP